MHRGALAMVAATHGMRDALFPFVNEAAGVFVVRFFRNRTRFDVLVVCSASLHTHEHMVSDITHTRTM